MIPQHVLPEDDAGRPGLSAAPGAKVLPEAQRAGQLAVKSNIGIASRLQLGQGREILADVDSVQRW